MKRWMASGLIAALCASSPAAAGPSAVVLLLEAERSLTLLDAVATTPAALEALALPVIAPPGPVDAAELVVVRVRSLAQWDQVSAVLEAGDHAPLRCEIQRLDGGQRVVVAHRALEPGDYLITVEGADGSTPQLSLTLGEGAISAR